MTRLRKMMLEELQRRNYAQNTIRHYLRAVEDFARRFRSSPDRLGPRHIREYQAELFQKRKLSANSVGQHLAALRFFYIKTLRRAWSIAETPYPKKTRRLPTILSREEVAQLFHAARTPGERILLMTLYATGARNSELTHLEVNDIEVSAWSFISVAARAAKIAMSCSVPSYSRHSAPTGVITTVNQAPGCSPATFARIAPSTRKQSGTRVTNPPSAPASKNTFIPIRCATVLLRISTRLARISARFRSCSVMNI